MLYIYLYDGLMLEKLLEKFKIDQIFMLKLNAN